MDMIKPKRKCSPAQRAALRKGRAKMKANAKARRQALALAVKDARAAGLAAAFDQSSVDVPAKPKMSRKARSRPAQASAAIKDRADDYLLSKALIGDGDLPSWLKD